MNDDPNGAGAGAGNPGGDQNGTGAEGQTPGPEQLFAELDGATREWVQTRHGNDVTKLAKQAHELDKFAGKAVALPGDDATDEDWGKFYTRLGRPESAEKYDFAVPTDLPESSPYNEELAKEFRSKAFELGVPQKTASALHDWFAKQQSDLAGDAQAKLAGDLTGDIEKANQTLESAWGAPTSETYKANLELAGRFFDAVDEKGGLSDVLAKRGLLGPQREVLIPELAFAFAKAGAAIYTEGNTLPSNGGDNLSGVNPFDGDINLTKVMALVKSDPDKARLFAKAAGVNAREYGL